MSATVASGCDHATGALAPKSSSQPNAIAQPRRFQWIGNLVDFGWHDIAYRRHRGVRLRDWGSF